jgi:hypothetical protein
MSLVGSTILLQKSNPSNAGIHLRHVHSWIDAPHWFDNQFAAKENEDKKRTIKSQFKLQATKFNPFNVVLEHLYRFFNSANVAVRQSKNEHLEMFMNYLIDNADVLKTKRKSIAFSPFKYRQIETRFFLEIMVFVRSIIRFSRDYYRDALCKDSVAFVCVSHDGWDSRRHDILGCSIHMIVPYHFVQISLPVGLQVLENKSSESVVQHLNKMLSRYDIKPEDIYRGINDTTNSALKAGQLLSSNRNLNTRNTCFMHSQELAVTHALGIRSRSRNKVITDSFTRMKDLIKKVRTLCTAISDRKSKGKQKQYKKFVLERFKVDAPSFVLPNDTRVAGTFLMFESLLKQKDFVMSYSNNFLKGDEQKKMEAMVLGNEEWDMLAEAESILRLTTILAMTSQVEETSYNSIAYFKVMNIRFALQQQRVFKCYDVRNVPSQDRQMGYAVQKDIDRDELNENSVMLLSRLEREYTTYFPEPDDDQVLQMFYHPFMQRSGFK